MIKRFDFQKPFHSANWGHLCLPLLLLLSSCAEKQASESELPVYTLKACAGKVGWRTDISFDMASIKAIEAKIEESVLARSDWDDLKKVEAIGPWKQYRVPGLVVATDAGVNLDFLANATALGLPDLADVVLVPGSQVGIVMNVGSPQQNLEQVRKWRNYVIPQGLPPPVFSNYSIRAQNGAWPFYQEFDRFKTGNPTTTFFASPENLWRCNVSQTENPVGNEDWVSCDAFYPKVDAALKVVFQRSLICHTPAIAVTVDAFLTEYLKNSIR